MAEFDTCVGGGELPSDLALVGVGGVLPGGEFGVEGVEVGDAAIEALAGQGGELDLGDVEPNPCRGVWWISSRCASTKALAGWNALVEGADGVGVEVVHHQHDGLGVGVLVGEQVIDLMGPVNLGSVRLGVDAAPAASGFDPDEDRAGALADVLAVLFPVVTGLGGDRSRTCPSSWKGFSSMHTTGRRGS